MYTFDGIVYTSIDFWIGKNSVIYIVFMNLVQPVFSRGM